MSALKKKLIIVFLSEIVNIGVTSLWIALKVHECLISTSVVIYK